MAGNNTNSGGGTTTTASIDRALLALDEALLEGGVSGGSGDDGAKAQAPAKTTTADQQPQPAADARATSSSADEEGGSKDVFSPAAYRKRLGTFRPMTYFAKPEEVSPLVCARFGWINSSHDMLACTSPSCRAAICVDISPTLSAESAQKMAKQYRQMLATAHTTVCPFRSDAERWLLDEESKMQSDGFVVSPFLLQMSNDYVVLENLAAGGLVARKMIRAAAVQLSEHLEQANMGLSKLNVTIPQKLVEFVEHEASVAGTTFDGVGAGSEVDRVSGWIYSALAGELKRSGDISEEVLAKKTSADDDFDKLVTNAPLLASLGWRPAVADADNNSDDAAVVECPLCLARTSLTCCTDINAGDAPPAKRQRTSDGDATSSSCPPVDLLISHRHYCPYVCSGACSLEGATMAGWKGILAMVARQYRDKENTNSALTEVEGDMKQKLTSGEETFQSVRSLLRTALPSEPKVDL